MGGRPITSWELVPTPDARWGSLHRAFSERLGSATAVDEALVAARRRWGSDRVAEVFVAAEERSPSERGIVYGKAGPFASAGVLRSAWALLERGVVDAVLAVAEDSRLLVERAGASALRLQRDERAAELHIDAAPDTAVHGVLTAAAAVELGLDCGEGGLEPESAVVRCGRDVWRLELCP